jgi:TonB-linked SusC/RagA family outer membrane protein
LQGKVSGLNVTSINNGVFADVKINLRGIRSLTGDNNPMLLLDGIQTAIGFLSSINPNDIQDVTILKGSSAASIYGPDGRNGVIVVTTKKGTRDGKPVVSVSSTVQLERVAFLPNFQTRFGGGTGVDAFGNGVYDPIENQQYGPEFDGSDVILGPVLSDGSQQMVKYSARPEEKRKFWNQGVTLQNDVSLQGQNFFLSAQHVDVKGVVPSDENKRTSFRFNSAKDYGKLHAGFNLAYIQQNFNILNQGQNLTSNSGGINQGQNEWGALQWLVFNTPMHVPLTSYKNWRTDKFAQFGNYFNEYYPNPYWVIDNYRSRGKNEDVVANTEFSFKATNWLTFTNRAALSSGFDNYKNTVGALSLSAYTLDHRDNTLYKNRNASVYDGFERNSRISSETFANISHRVGDFQIGGVLGHYFRQIDIKSTDIGGTNLVVPTLFNVGNRTGEPSVAEFNSRERLLSAFGSASVSYKGWANLELTGRNDWTSLLAKENNSYFYPGVNVSLVLSDAVPTFKNSALISFLKLRGSANKTGTVNVNAYQLQSTFTQANGFPYGNQPGFSANNGARDPNLKPEFINNLEVGFELGLLKNRINLEVAAYQQNNTDQVISVGTSSATGYTSSLVNAANFENKGFEIDLRLTPIVRFNKGSIELRTNFSYNDSKINSLYQGLGELFVGGFTTGGQAGNFAIVGKPAFVFKGLDYQRDDLGRVIVDKTTGYPFLNTSQDTFGRTLPKYILGLTPSFNWNGFNLAIVGEYRGGHYSYHGVGPDMDFSGISERSARNGRQRFVFPNSVYDDGTGKYVENTDVTVANGGNSFYTSVTYNRNVATNYITSAASWRIREISLGYDIPTKWFGKAQQIFKKANLSLVARNVAIWLPASNEWTDPDFNFTTGNAAGINTSSISPPTRIFGGNLTLTF